MPPPESVVVCAWCGKTMPAGAEGGAARVSHGICPSCAARLRESDPAGALRESRMMPLELFLHDAARLLRSHADLAGRLGATEDVPRLIAAIEAARRHLALLDPSELEQAAEQALKLSEVLLKARADLLDLITLRGLLFPSDRPAGQ
jgi:hypothetical protein